MKLHGMLWLVDPQHCRFGFPLLIVGEDNIIQYLLDDGGDIDELFVVVRYGHEFWFNYGPFQESQPV